MKGQLRRGLVAAVALAGIVATAAACGGSGSSSNQAKAGGKTELVVKTFGDFGYKDLYKQYEASHPNVTIKEENIAQLGDYLPKLQQWMATGSGAGDVVALEEGILVQFMAKPANFVNLLDHGAGSLQDKFLEWKWKQALTPDGKTLVGLGTDVGAQGMCYRRDLFEKAGLPTDREEVSKLWPTWDAYIETGKKFVAASKEAKFFDSAGNIFQNVLIQQGDHTYFDTSNKLVIDTNPAVKSAWDITTRMVAAGLSAKLQMWGPQWNAGFKQGSFATIACPAWMLGLIKEQAGDGLAGKWDVAKVPGSGAVRGGSFLAVPAQSKHQKEAAELVKFLTSPEGQLGAFKAANNFPSSPQAIDDPAVQGFSNAFFNNAPVGKIFGESAKSLKPIYLGPDNQVVQDRVGDALLALEQGKLDAGAAWTKALDDAKRAAK
ncbi:ABC transporter substrate-binding protein [Nonomuraea sediminis]|uniref:ABC transporter substrate-binding protein n=1 Tax=Nonomuraea sediminis TaxID=2835864 RepID=UPI001BDD83A5|nr:extracellular solute-binding protein [Nonomuraea sediminis]